MSKNIVLTPVGNPIVSGLQEAIEATVKLAEANCRVIGSWTNGRRTVLHVAAPPSFVSGSCKSRHRNGSGGYTRHYAAPFFGVQLEWLVEERCAVQEVGHA